MPPLDLVGDLQPLGVLVEHRVDQVDERLIGGEEAVPAGQQVSLQPALDGVLGQDLHHPAVGGKMIVIAVDLAQPGPVGDFQNVLPPVGVVLVRGEEPEVAGLLVERNDVTEERAHDAGRLGDGMAGPVDLDLVVAEVGHPKRPSQATAVGVRIRAHLAFADGMQLGDLGYRPAFGVEELFGTVELEPLAQLLESAPGSAGCRRTAPDGCASSPRRAFRRSSPGRSIPWAS